MKRTLLLMVVRGTLLTNCKTTVTPNDSYLVAATKHCNNQTTQLVWLQAIVASGTYQKPNATVPAPIKQIALWSHDGNRVFVLDSDLSSCITCPWAVLDYNGQPFMSKSSLTPVREQVIWQRQ